MASTLISVIIPVWNGQTYLGAAIDSVWKQTVSSHEIIVVDDGSSDRSLEIVDTYGLAVRTYCQPHLGPAAARNLGIRQATGDLLAFLDADDLWLPEKLARQMTLMQAQPQLDAVLGQIESFVSPEVDETTRQRLRVQPEPQAGYHVGALLIRRDSFLRVGLFDEQLPSGEFIDWWARAMDGGVVYAVLPEVVMRRRVHGQNYTLTPKGNAQHYARVARMALQRRRHKG